MRQAVVIALAGLWAGCAITPSEVIGDAPPQIFTSPRPPQQAATCVERNASEVTWGIFGQTVPSYMRPGSEAGTYEVVYGTSGATMAVAIIRPRDAGSTIAVHRPRLSFGEPRGDATLAEQFAKGC